MSAEVKEGARENLADALKFMKSAIDILDASSAPGDIAAYLDIAIVRLESHLGCCQSGG